MMITDDDHRCGMWPSLFLFTFQSTVSSSFLVEEVQFNASFVSVLSDDTRLIIWKVEEGEGGEGGRLEEHWDLDLPFKSIMPKIFPSLKPHITKQTSDDVESIFFKFFELAQILVFLLHYKENFFPIPFESTKTCIRVAKGPFEMRSVFRNCLCSKVLWSSL